MDSVRVLKTELSVTNIDDVAEDLIFKNKISFPEKLRHWNYEYENLESVLE